MTNRHRYSDEYKMQVVNYLHSGKGAKQICKECDLSLSTFYSWLKPYKQEILSNNRCYSPKEIDKLRISNKRLQSENNIYKKLACSPSSPLEEKLIAIKENKATYSVHTLCNALNVRRSTFYHFLNRKPIKTTYELSNEKLRPLIKEVFDKSRGRYGSNRIQVVLKKQKINVGTKKILELMKELELKVHIKKQKVLPKGSKNKFYTNKLQQKFNQEHPNMAWVSDVTYIKVSGEFYYLCVVIDLYSRKVISYKLTDKQDADLSNETFMDAYISRNRPSNLIFHSDRGTSYTDFYFRKLLRTLNVKQSFSRTAYPYDNAVAESFFGIIKKEEINRQPYYSIKELSLAVDEYINFYNTERIHQSLNYVSPNEFEQTYLDKIEKRI